MFFGADRAAAPVRSVLLSLTSRKSLSSMMRRCGASIVSTAESSLTRDTRFPVDGSLTMWTRFQTIWPA
ncbi:hypothetical protein ATY75_03235 [Rhizobium sp. N122]|nr:hypothetical protein ATY75_03235 [Rhizobium sp. N122]